MQKMVKDVKGMQLNCRFALPPNSLGYCGKDSAPEKFKKCVINCECKGVGAEFEKFIVLHPYLKTLSKVYGLPKNSYKVAESYWLGNNKLKKVNRDDYLKLLKNFELQGVPQWLVDELKTEVPSNFIPTHLFQVLHVGVGRASGSVPYNLESANNCMIRWGKVVKINDDNATVSLNSLKLVNKKYSLTKITETYPVMPNFIKNLKKGDIVTAHWKIITKRLTADEVKKIEFWTREVIKSVNETKK